jgi:hypothetical protein
VTAAALRSRGFPLTGSGGSARLTGLRQPGVALPGEHLQDPVALIGFLGSAMGLADLPDLIAGKDLERPWAVAVQSIMAAILLVYMVLAIKSFLGARKARANA